MLEVRNLSVNYGKRPILRNVSFSVLEGQWLMIVGPNGAGKSTLIGAIAQSVPFDGQVILDGEDARRMKPARRARKMGVLMQNHSLSYGFTVEEIVRLGRYAYAASPFSPRTDEDEMAFREAVRLTGLEPLLTRSALAVSGGELQRSFLAQLLCQNPGIMLLDEPTNHLDLKYQREIFSLVRDWLRAPGRAVVSVAHDLSLARTYGTHALLLKDGNIVSSGKMETALTPENLSDVYEMDVAGWMRELFQCWN